MPPVLSTESIAHPSTAEDCCPAAFYSRLCRLWVRLGHSAMSAECPLYPDKRTSTDATSMSAWCQEETFSRMRSVSFFTHRGEPEAPSFRWPNPILCTESGGVYQWSRNRRSGWQRCWLSYSSRCLDRPRKRT